jgi:hypothetical protein
MNIVEANGQGANRMRDKARYGQFVSKRQKGRESRAKGTQANYRGIFVKSRVLTVQRSRATATTVRR